MWVKLQAYKHITFKDSQKGSSVVECELASNCVKVS